MTYSVRAFNIEAITPPEGLADFQWPATWVEPSADTLPLDLEIGCGVGWHPIAYAKANPNRRLIAIEHTRAKFERFQTRLGHHTQLTNVIGIHGDAIRWVTHLIKPESISRCFLMYPNPEPKAPNKRWLRMPFMERLILNLTAGGEIHLATNEESYYQEAVNWAQNAWHLQVAHARSFDQLTIGHAPRTHFEKKYLLRGETCYEAVFRKA